MIRTLKRALASVAIAITPIARNAPIEAAPEPERVSDEERKLDKAFGACFAAVRPEVLAKYDGPKDSADEQIMLLLKARNMRFRNTALMAEAAHAEVEQFVQARTR